MKTVYVELDQFRYPIYIGSGLLTQASLLAKHIHGRQICIITNAVIATHYLDGFKRTLNDLLNQSMSQPLTQPVTQPVSQSEQENKTNSRIETVILPEGETHKNQAAIDQIYESLLTKRFARDCVIIALGGGIVGDVAGFAAASYQRGVDFIQIPTTLLAQVDSSVGGKTGINHRLGKNMIGAFKQPNAVIIDTDVLSTLPQREIAAGMAEVIKYGLIRDKAFLMRLDTILESTIALSPSAITEVIETACRHKAAVVANDEKEKGERATLNLGHTFGHAIESVTQYKTYLHGEAIAIGMMMALDLSKTLGWIDQADCDLAESLFVRAGCPTTLQIPIAADTIRSAMQHDKKVLGERLRLILVKALGEAVICEGIDESLILDCITNRTIPIDS
ncbi:3-dehydroquinate synthase [Ostreibacterium oceani]|uniref:3-dehydroquinate synthase n=1 Tax=Ostreibacterium oceani TaxID=2654998 RepID=A0A6N7EY44_9GAMM|nr:3-dehydroquinate synthase [Ostreibacterium oceani]MPV86495.1 3-dehydroquinate synthase [Ostreibacterium oceani]